MRPQAVRVSTHVTQVGKALVCQNVFLLGYKVAFPCALCTAVLKYLHQAGAFADIEFTSLIHSSLFSNFTILISLFLAFRASHAYTRFWTGACSMFAISAEFFDVASSLVAFSRNSNASLGKVSEFRHLVMRLFSMLHALILADLEAEGCITGNEQAFKYELIDVQGIDPESLAELKQAGPRQMDLVFQWLQSLIVEAHQSGVLVVPPPILSRAFQELNAGIMEYHRTLALAEVPFPLPYTAATQVVLVLHWLLTPIMACTWSVHALSSSILAFVIVFMLWSLNAIAQELENPFGSDLNDLDTMACHSELNARLKYLLHIAGQKAPKLCSAAMMDFNSQSEQYCSENSFKEIWFSEDQQTMHDSRKEVPSMPLCEALEPSCSAGATSAKPGLQQSEQAMAPPSAYKTCESVGLEQAITMQWQRPQDSPHESLSLEALQILQTCNPATAVVAAADADVHPVSAEFGLHNRIPVACQSHCFGPVDLSLVANERCYPEGFGPCLQASFPFPAEGKACL